MADRESDPLRGDPLIGNLSVSMIVDGERIGIIPTEDIVECWFIEDIYSYCMTGKLKFYDSIKLIEKGPFTGSEKVIFTYGATDRREIIFDIWDTPEIIQAAANRSTDKSLIECTLVDSAFGTMFYTNTSTSWPKNTLYTKIVHDILSNILKWEPSRINIEESDDFYDEGLAFPWWSPVNMIGWILKRTASQRQGTSGYLCYNNTFNTNSVNVYTLNHLFSENNAVDDQDYVFTGQTVDVTQNKILDWSISGVDQSLMRVVRGGQFKGFDQNTKRLMNYHYTYKDGIEDTIILGRKSLLPDISDDKTSHDIIGGDAKEMRNVIYDEWVKRYCLQFMVDFIVQGNEKRYAGLQIQVRWPSSDPEKQSFQKQLEGLYLVKSITHSFTGHGNNINYIQKLRLIKNGFQDSSSISLLNAKKSKLTYKAGTNIVLRIE